MHRRGAHVAWKLIMDLRRDIGDCSPRGLTEPDVCVRRDGLICGRKAIFGRIRRLKGSGGRELVYRGAACATLWWALAAEKG